jgi:hypothetical protein
MMLKSFGGLAGFSKAYAAYHRFALEQFRYGRGAPLFKSMSDLALSPPRDGSRR